MPITKPKCMKKLLFLFAALFVGFQLFGQTDERQEEAARRDLDYYNRAAPRAANNDRFGASLWYGGGLQLGFSSFNSQSFFNIGLSPMVGYKVTNNISFGPRVAISYNSFRQRAPFTEIKANYITWAAGVFGRVRVINPFFAHVEYSLESDVIGFLGNEPVRRNRGVPYVGAGYSPFNPGGGSSEMLLLFRLAPRSQIVREAPYVIRFGINFNF